MRRTDSGASEEVVMIAIQCEKRSNWLLRRPDVPLRVCLQAQCSTTRYSNAVGASVSWG